MPRYKITVEYNGLGSVGWQKQPDKISIQSQIEEAIFKLCGKKTDIAGSGRTDAGVHATAQIAHFDLEKEFRPFEVMMALNHYLNDNDHISIIDCAIADKDFHSRFHAKLRHYQYKILNRRAAPALDKYRVWHVPYELDLSTMQNACKYLIGKHDFSSFRDSECQAQDPIKTIKNIQITQAQDLILIDISAPSFLHHMVRNIVGTLAMVGGNKMAADDIKGILEAKDRTKSGPNAPAYGLYLRQIDY